MLEAHVVPRATPRVLISDEREQILNSGGGVLKALPLLGPGPFFSLNADTIWMDGPVSNLRRMADMFDPGRMDVLLMVAAAAAADRLFGLRLDGIFMHVGTPEAVREAEDAIARSQL